MGEEAKKLFNNAQIMLQKIIEGKWLEARAIVSFHAANTVDHDDIELYSPENEAQVVGKLHTLRQ